MVERRKLGLGNPNLVYKDWISIMFRSNPNNFLGL
jgi:hypothetical protein